MVRRTDIRRDSRPESPALFNSLEEKAELEARNGLLQFYEVIRLLEKSLKSGSRLKLTPSILKKLLRIAIQDIYICAGNFRNRPIHICGTDHEPPPFETIPQLVRQMCRYVNDNLNLSPIHLSAYLMWRINWIHPFNGGNGRTARAVSYLILSSALGYRLPGSNTIPDQIIECRYPYYEALDAADAAWRKGKIEVKAMEKLLSNMLASQLLDVVKKAKGR